MRSIFASSIQPSPSPLLSAFQVRSRVPLSVFSSFSSRRTRLGAIERDSEFEIDRDKALAALEQFDKQLTALSEKETVPSRNRPSSSSPYSDPDTVRQEMMGMGAEESAELSGSALASAATALIILTIFNNLIFWVFVKPSVDGEFSHPITLSQRSQGTTDAYSPEVLTFQQAP